MGWLFDRKVHSRTEPQIKFVGEQDGESERDLKSLFVEVLKEYPDVRAAYLAQAIFKGSNTHDVVLCVACAENAHIVKAVTEIFGKMFSSGNHLDVIFIDSEKEKEVKDVCKSFFTHA